MPARRPALIPALLFLSASWLFASGQPWALAIVTLAAGLVAVTRGNRKKGVVFCALAWSFGVLHGSTTAIEYDASRGELALYGPLAMPSERSWVGIAAKAPRRIDDRSWRLELEARPEGEPNAGDSRLVLEILATPATKRLEPLEAGTPLRVWARTRVVEPTRPSRSSVVRGRVKSALLVETVGRRDAGGPNRLQRIRDRLVDRLWRLYGDDERLAGFASAVLLGERTFRHEATEARLRGAGLAHLLAISGLHVAIVAGVLSFLLRRFHRVRAPAVALLLLAFGLLTGGAVPVRRAVGVVWLFLLGRSIGRDGEPLNRLACVALILPWFLDGGIDSAPFALSFAATAGILATLQRHDTHANSTSMPVTALRATTGAYIATAPLSALYFCQLAPWALLANLIATPFVALFLISGYLGLLVEGIPVLGPAAIAATRWSFDAIDWIAAVIDRLPASPWYVAPPGPGLLLLFVAAAVTRVLTHKVVPRRLSTAALGVGLVLMHLGPPPAPPGPTIATLLDVGQGQALLWNDRAGTTLIDAAGATYGRWDPGAQVVRPELLARGVRRIDRLILSHGHADHAAGAFALLDGVEVGELWVGPGWWRDERLREIASCARDQGTAVRLVWQGHDSRGIRVVFPARDEPLTGNAGSLALLLGTSPNDLFVPGDLDGPALLRAIESDWVRPVEALVLAHHGSRRGTPDALLEKMQPRLALVSCGRNNRFGHPHPETLQRLSTRGVRLWRTDHVGTVELRFAGKGWTARTLSPE